MRKNILGSFLAALFAVSLVITFDATSSGIGGSSGVGGSAPSLKVYSDVFSVNLATASGPVAYTGVGFKPKAIILFGGLQSSGAAYATMGLVTDSGAGDDQVGIYSYSGCTADTFRASSTRAIYFYETCANNYIGNVSSLDADGFTIDWTKSGTPTAIVTVTYLVLG